MTDDEVVAINQRAINAALATLPEGWAVAVIVSPATKDGHIVPGARTSTLVARLCRRCAMELLANAFAMLAAALPPARDEEPRHEKQTHRGGRA